MLHEDEVKAAAQRVRNFWSLRYEPAERGEPARAVAPWREYRVGQPVMLTSRDQCGVIEEVFIKALQMHGLLKTWCRLGVFEWQATDSRKILLIESQQQFLLLPPYWCRAGLSMITLG